MIATVSDPRYADVGVPWFPLGHLRFQLAGTGDGTLIVGTSTFARPHDFGGIIGTVTEELARGRFWRLASGSWVEVPLLDETSESDHLASVACDVNADGVIVGAICEPLDPYPNGRWRFRPAYWLPGASGHTAYLFDPPAEDCIEEGAFNGIAYGVGQGALPQVAGSAFVQCNVGSPEAFGASLADFPDGTEVVPLNRAQFSCSEADPGEVALSEALAVAVSPELGPYAVGYEFSFDPQAEPEAPSCIFLAMQCDLSAVTGVRALTWWLPSPVTPYNPGPVIADSLGYRFRAFDGAAGPAASGLPAWSIAGGHSLDEPDATGCHLHATVTMGYLPDTEEYGTVTGQGLSFDVHGAIYDALDPPNDPDEDLVASAIGAICHATASVAEVTDVAYLAAGARYFSDSNNSYGVIWIGSRDGEGGWQWCGRRADDPDVTWLPTSSASIAAVHDILPSGIAVALARIDVNTNAVVLLTALCDLNGDFKVDGTDLGLLLGGWGDTPPPNTYLVGDLNRDSSVDGTDLGFLLSGWDAGPVSVFVDCAPKLWQPISPIDVEEASRLLGFDGLQHLGQHLAHLPTEDASELGLYVNVVAQAMHQE